MPENSTLSAIPEAGTSGTPATGAGSAPHRNKDLYYPELDVLRFGAFFLVYVSHLLPIDPRRWLHLGFPPVLARAAAGFVNGGHYGVDLFFALSAYLITELLLREYRLRRTIDVKAFYMRRILRIWPLYFLALFLIPPVLRAIKPDEPLLSGRLLIAFTFLMGNWARVWWAFPDSATSPLWSVSIEEQFYLLWPLIMNRWIRHIRAIAVGLIVCAFAARAYCILGQTDPHSMWFNTFCRLDSIAGGVLLAATLNGRTPRFSLNTRIAMIAGGLGLLALCGMFLEDGPICQIVYPLAAVASVLTIAGTLRPAGDLRKARPLRPFICLGRISYGLYIFHASALHLTGVPSSSSVRWALNIAESFALTVLLAAVSYRFIETPFLRLKEKFSYIRSVPLAVALS